ncbi:MAG: M1 family peptidase, partial [Chitinophagaceae bacterium]
MNIKKFKCLAIALLSMGATIVQAQQPAAAPAGNYNPHDAFSPLFYTQNGNSYRSASGYPGPNYWQNRADYNIAVNLDEATSTVSGTISITYKNNSPDQLPFVWLMLEQNSFADNSRGAQITGLRSRYGKQGEIMTGGYTIKNLSVTRKGKAVNFSSIVEDTRMQLRFDDAMTAN